MSDTFNHEADAWDDRFFNEGRYEDEEYTGAGPRKRRPRSCTSIYPQSQDLLSITNLFEVNYPSELLILAETPLAVLYSAKGKQAWVPRSLTKCADSCSGPMIPRWLYMRIAHQLHFA